MSREVKEADTDHDRDEEGVKRECVGVWIGIGNGAVC